MKKFISVFIALICLSLCACNNAGKLNDENANDSANTESGKLENTESADTSISLPPVTEKSAEAGLIFEETNFTPILTEDDIEYLGKPYKDLTVDEFIQLWAQSTRESNAQRLYVLLYYNGILDDSLSDEEKEVICEEECKWHAKQILWMELYGRVLFGYYDVELHELEDAPDGYYENVNDDSELHYMISYKSIMYENGEINYEGEDLRWITLKKENGYWKIGIQFSSSPYFFDENF